MPNKNMYFFENVFEPTVNDVKKALTVLQRLEHTADQQIVDMIVRTCELLQERLDERNGQ